MTDETLILLGTGNATVTKCFNTCFAIKTGEEYFLVDTGGGNGIMTQLEKAPRYWGYGLFMLILYILTGSAWYAMPGTVCLTLSVVCRSGQAEEARL